MGRKPSQLLTSNVRRIVRRTEHLKTRVIVFDKSFAQLMEGAVIMSKLLVRKTRFEMTCIYSNSLSSSILREEVLSVISLVIRCTRLTPE